MLYQLKLYIKDKCVKICLVIFLKVLLYTENEKIIGKSGLGKAIKHQIQALKENNIEYTTNPNDDYDIVHR